MKKVLVLLALCIFSYALTSLKLAKAGSNETETEKEAKVLFMFRYSGPAREASGLKLNLSEEEFKEQVVTNEEVMSKIRKRCKKVEFVGNTIPLGKDEIKRKVDNLSKDIDGIVVFGTTLTDKLRETNLPKIVVFPLWGMWQQGFTYPSHRKKEMRVLTSHISVVRDKSDAVFASRFDDLAKKIKMIRAIAQMEGLKILSVTDHPPLGAYTSGYGDPEKYEKQWRNNLNDLGVELKTIPQEELYDKVYQDILKSEKDRAKAEQIAEMWINQAKEIAWNEISKEDIEKSAALYLAMKELRDKYDCTNVTTEGYGQFAGYKKGPIPSQGMASTQLFTEEEFAAPSETLIYSLLTQQLGFYATGRKGHNGDYVIDHANNIAQVMHCEGALNPYTGSEDEERIPFDLRELPQHYDSQVGAIALIRYPTNKTVTVVGWSIHDKKIGVFTGESVPPENYYDNLEYNWCRSKIFVKTDTEALLENVNWKAFHQHRVAFYGDLREEFKNLATLMGYDFIEMDK